MSYLQQIITIALCVLATMLTRFLPFMIFSESRPTPKFILYIGRFLPSSVFAMLVVYCLRYVSFTSGNFGIPEIVSILLTCVFHVWKRQMLISIAAGTICYMVLC